MPEEAGKSLAKHAVSLLTEKQQSMATVPKAVSLPLMRLRMCRPDREHPVHVTSSPSLR